MAFTIPPFLRIDAHPSRYATATPQNALQAPLAGSTDRFFLLSDQERRTICGALEFAVILGQSQGRDGKPQRDLISRLEVDEPPDRMTRAQELAADAMSAKHGRCAVRHQGDGSVVITGLLDDIEREVVCVERDGTERWRQ